MKRLGAFAAAMIVLLQGMALSVGGAEAAVGYSVQRARLRAEDPGMVFHAILWEYGDNDFILPVPLGGDVREMELPHFPWAYNFDTLDKYLLRFAWRYDDIDTDVPGYQQLGIDIEMPKRYTYIGDEDEFEVPEFSIQVLVYDPEAEEPAIQISEVKWECVYMGLPLPVGGDVSKLGLPHFAWAANDDTYEYFLLDHTWKFDAFDSGELGYQDLKAEVKLPLGYSYIGYDEEWDGEVEYAARVTVYDPEGAVEPVPQVWYYWVYTPWSDALMDSIPLGASDEYLLEMKALMNGRATVTTENLQFFDFDVDMDISKIDTSQPGTYYPFTPLPPYLRLTPEGRQATAMHVLEPDEVDLRAWRMSRSGGIISFEWLKGVKEPELWVSVDEGEWQPADTLTGECDGYPVDSEYLFEFEEYYGYPTINSMYINEEYFLTGHSYEFEVRYEDGGRSVNTYMMDLREGHLVYAHDGEGPRGGADRYGMRNPYDDEDEGDNTEPTTESTTEPTQPTAEPTQPTTEPTQPTAEPTRPTTEPTQPTAESTQPTTAPVTIAGDSRDESGNESGPDAGVRRPSKASSDNLEAAQTVGKAMRQPGAVPVRATPAAVAGEPEGEASAQAELPVQDNAEPSAPREPETSAPTEAPSTAVPADEGPAPKAVEPVDNSAEPSSPIAGPVSVAIVGAAGAGGVALVWKLLGKRLVKPR
ncbi:hypothetical protein LJC63_06420 [Ruminococcaceae bacterium OttesenSCG-928-L11]|nr:hypothetical protein [Ruminococcaceae bacterium OttesenSCG-928-L11]